MAAQLSDALTLTHQVDFGKAKLLTLGQILRRFVGQVGLPIRSVNDRVHHGGCLRVSFSFEAGTRCNGWFTRHSPDALKTALRNIHSQHCYEAAPDSPSGVATTST